MSMLYEKALVDLRSLSDYGPIITPVIESLDEDLSAMYMERFKSLQMDGDVLLLDIVACKVLDSYKPIKKRRSDINKKVGKVRELMEKLNLFCIELNDEF